MNTGDDVKLTAKDRIEKLEKGSKFLIWKVFNERNTKMSQMFDRIIEKVEGTITRLEDQHRSVKVTESMKKITKLKKEHYFSKQRSEVARIVG